MADRTITIKGSGSVSAKPDLIIISMELSVEAETYQETMQLAESKLINLRNALVLTGYDKTALKTTDFNINTNYESYKDNDCWKRQFKGYVCNHRLTLEFDFSMDQLNRTLSSIACCSAQPEFSIAFSVKDKTAVSEQLLKNAIADATKKASVLAEAANVTLGSIQHIDYNWGELRLYSDTNIQPLMKCSEAEACIDIEPDDIEASDSVTVIWSIE